MFNPFELVDCREISKIGEAESRLPLERKTTSAGKGSGTLDVTILARIDVILLGQRVVIVQLLSGIPATFIRQRNKLQLSSGPGAIMIVTSCNSVILLDTRPRIRSHRFPLVDCGNGRVSPPLLEMDRTRYLIIGYGAHASIP